MPNSLFINSAVRRSAVILLLALGVVVLFWLLFIGPSIERQVRREARIGKAVDTVEAMAQESAMPIQPYQQRVFQERLDLDQKIDKLETFLKTPEAKKVQTAERGRMERQLAVMKDYSAILHERIEAFPKE